MFWWVQVPRYLSEKTLSRFNRIHFKCSLEAWFQIQTQYVSLTPSFQIQTEYKSSSAEAGETGEKYKNKRHREGILNESKSARNKLQTFHP